MKRFNPADGSAPFICAGGGDETAKAVVEQYITYVGAGIVNFVNILRPGGRPHRRRSQQRGGGPDRPAQ